MVAAQTVEVLITGNAERLKAAFAESSEAASASSATMGEKMAGIGKAATVAFAGAAVAVAAFSLKMADDFEQSHARLTQAIKNSGASWKSEEDAISRVDSKMEHLGFTNADTENALSRLVTATGNVKQSTELMGLAADIARARHMDLASATDVLVKVEGGRFTQLGRLLGVSKDTIASFKDSGDAIDYLTQKFGGQAQAYTETFSGKVQVLKATLEDLAVKIGMALIPVIETLATVVSDTVQWFEKHQAAAIALGVVVGGPLVAAMATYVATQAAAVGSKLADFWLGAYGAATRLVGEVGGLAAAYEAEYAAELQALGATEAQTDALVAQAAAAGGAEAGLISLSTVGLAAVGAGLLAVTYAITDSGKSLDDYKITVAELKTESLPQLAQRLGDLETYFRGTNTESQQYAESGGAAALKAVRDQAAAADRAKEAHKEFLDTLGKSPEFAQKFIDAATKAGIKTADWKAELANHVQKTQEAQAAQELYNQKIDGVTTAITEQNIQLQKNIDLTKKQVDAALGSAQSDLRSADAMKALSDAGWVVAVTSGQDADANQRLQQATLDAIGATEAQIEAHRKAGESTELAKIQLEHLRDTLDPGSPLRAQLDAYIDQLNSVPATKGTQVYVSGTVEANQALETLRNNLEYMTGQPWPVIVQVTSEFDNMQGIP